MEGKRDWRLNWIFLGGVTPIPHFWRPPKLFRSGRDPAATAIFVYQGRTRKKAPPTCVHEPGHLPEARKNLEDSGSIVKRLCREGRPPKNELTVTKRKTPYTNPPKNCLSGVNPCLDANAKRGKHVFQGLLRKIARPGGGPVEANAHPLRNFKTEMRRRGESSALRRAPRPFPLAQTRRGNKNF